MKILFDQGTPVPLRTSLPSHSVDTAMERSWHTLNNGELPDAAEADGQDLLLITDQNLRYQQNLAGRKIAILVLMSASWPRIQRKIPEIQDALEAMEPGSYVEVPI